jgi:MOSC domain-containing protein YiiM
VPAMGEQDKLRVLVPHWIEHNAEHAAEFRRWIGSAGDAAADIQVAADQMEAANQALRAALEKLAGPTEYHQLEHHHGGQASIKAVCRSQQRNDPKVDMGQGELRAGWGLVGDSHAGPPRSGRWQISLLSWEEVQRANREYGLDAVPGSFAENLTTEGLDTASLKVGDRLTIGDEVVLEVQQQGKPPEIAHTYSFEGHSLLPTLGVFCGIVTGGHVRAGDRVVILPR